MAEPIRVLLEWPAMRGQRVLPQASAGQILRQDPLQQAIQIIARNELRVWFEPEWHNARILARRFRHCVICSIPVESDTPAFRRIPDWRPKPDNGCV